MVLEDLVLKQWSQSNALFMTPVVISQKTLSDKILTAWIKFRDISNRKETKEKIIKLWEGKLDKLLDITKCRCKILLCTGENSPCKELKKCAAGVHISCSCSKDIKVPQLDLLWLRSQREKVGEKSGYQMYQIDKVETERQVKAGKRKITDIASLEKRKNSIKKAHINTQVQIENVEDEVYESVGHDFNQETSLENIRNANEISSEDSSNNIKQKPSPFVTIKQNYMKIPNTALASLRFDISPAATSAIVSAFLQDLIKSNYLTPNG